MYKNLYFDRNNNKVHLWTDGKHNDKLYETFNFKRYAYIVDPTGDKLTLTGLKVKKVNSWSKDAEKSGMIFEHDIPTSTRVLIDRYYQTDDVSVDHTILFFDIEVEKGLKYSTAKEAKNKIPSIAYYDTTHKKYVCLLLNESGTIEDCTRQINGIDVYVKVYRTEANLLTAFITQWNKIAPSLVTGWNCISAGTYIATDCGLRKIENLSDATKLAKGTAQIVFSTGMKREWIVENHVGTIINCSSDHIFPCFLVPSGKYINPNSLEKYKREMTVREMSESLNANECIIKVPKLKNNNQPLTFKKLLIDNFDIFDQYDKFDFVVKSDKVVQFVKANPVLFPTITQTDCWGKHANNKWRYRSLKNLPKSLVLEFIESNDVIKFAFNTIERTELIISSEISTDFMQLLGLIYTDGHYSKRTNSYNICNKDEKIIRHYVDIMFSSKLKKSYQFNRQRRDQCFYVDCSTQNYLGFLFPLIYHYSNVKNLNVELLSQLSYKQFQSFFAGLIDGDGSVTTNVVSIGNWETKIENNINSLQQLLFSNGVLSTIFTNNLRIRARGINNNEFISGLNIISSARGNRFSKIKYGATGNSKTKKYRYFETDTDYLVKIRNIYESDSFCEMYDINTDVGYFQANSMLVHNCDTFDVPYLYNRTINVLGTNWANKLSPIEIVEQRDINKRDIVISIAGIAQMDYLQLYKKFTYNEESSYTLEAISQKELGRGKYKYEGSLDNLYETNLDGFIEYNVNDVELIVALDKKMDLIEIARGICHKGHVPYDDFQFSSKYLDGAILARCARKGIVTVSKSGKDEGKAIGAFVKPPQIGKHNWVYSLDFQSLYPSVIITQNISPETQVAVIQNWDSLILSNKLVDGVNLHNLSDFGYLDDNVQIKVHPIIHDLFSERSTEPLLLNKSEFIDYAKQFNATISSAGVMFQTQTKGIIPEILEGWFEERQMFKAKMKEYEVGSEMYVYYDRMQLITKILLNSLYGVLLLPSFRYYSKLNGESVTRSGQSLIKFADFMANLFYKKRLGDEYKTNCVLYGDSDSVYLSGNQAIANIDTKTEIEIVKETQQLSDEVCQFLNRAVGWFAKHCFHSSNNRLIFNQEKVSKRAFWGQAKKRYAQLSVSIKDDQLVEKLDIKGFDVVRSSFPKAFRKILKELIIDILHDVSIEDLNAKIRKFKKEYANSALIDIMLPTGVKEMSKYEVGQKGTPIYYKAAQNYNSMLKLHKIETLPLIDDGDKIIYAYMKSNPFGFETMALRGYDDPKEIVEFVERFIDKEKVFENAFLSKVDTIWEDLNFGKVQLQEESNFF